MTTAAPADGMPSPATTAMAARQGALGLAGGLCAGVGGLALTVVVGRLLSRAEAGVYFTAVATFTILSTVLVLGADTGVLRGLSGLRAAGRRDQQRGLLGVALWPVAGVGVLASFVLFVLAGRIAARLFDGSTAPQMGVALRVLAPFLAVSTLSVVLLNGATRGLDSLRTFTLVQQVLLPLVRPVLVAAAVLILAAAGIGPHGQWTAPATVALLAWALPLVAALAVAAREVRRRLPPPTVIMQFPPTPPAAFWRATAPRGVAASFEVLIVWADVVLVTAVLGVAPAAVYAAASRFVTSGTLGLQAIRLSVSPMLAAAFARGDTVEAAMVHRLSVRWAILSTWPVYLAMAVFAPGVLSILGHGYGRASGALTVLALAMLGVAATGNANTVLNMAHRSHWAAWNTGTATIVMLTLDLVLIPRLGILGAAIGWAAAMLTDASLGMVQVRHGLGLHSFDRSTARAAAVAVLAFGAPALAVRLLAATALDDALPPAVLLIVGCLVAGSSYAAVLIPQRRALGLDHLVTAVRHRRAPA